MSERKELKIQKFSKKEMKEEQILEVQMRINVWKQSEQEKRTAKEKGRDFYNINRDKRFQMTKVAACVFDVMTEDEYQDFLLRIEKRFEIGKSKVQPFRFQMEPHKTKAEIKKEEEKAKKILEGKKVIAAGEKKRK